MPFTMGLDVGTTTLKAVVFDTDSGKVVSISKKPTPTSHPIPGWSHHAPGQLWQTTIDIIREAKGTYNISAISISSFAEAGLPLDEHLKPLYPVIAWFDTRSQPQLANLSNVISDEEIFNITGQKAGFSFGLLKLMWLRSHHPEIFNRMTKWVSVPDFIHFRLCGRLATDYTQASRTLLFDQQKRDWSERLARIAAITPKMLPEIFPSGTAIGSLSLEASESTGLPTSTVCVLGGHDHLCGAFASGGLSPGQIIDSMGTSQAVIAITDHLLRPQILFNKGYVQYPHVIPDTSLVKAGLKAAGRVLAWYSEVFRASPASISKSLLSAYSQELPVWLPFFEGSGTPDRKPDARAALFGLHVGHSSDEIILSLLEGFAFWLRHNRDSLIEITNQNPLKTIAIGGSNQNEVLQILKATILRTSIEVPSTPEPSAVGAALLAAVGNGITPTYAHAAALSQYPVRQISPNQAIEGMIEERYQEKYLPLRKSLLEL